MTATATQPPLPGPPRPGPFAAPTTRAKASPPVQVAVYLVCVLAIGLASLQAHNVSAFLLCAGGLTVGVVVGLSVDLSRLFASIAGWVWGLVATTVVLVVIGMTNRGIPLITAVVIGLAVTGLDWSQVTRLRAVVVLSGVFVVPLVGAKEPWAFPAALAWFVGVLAALWLLERDARLVVPTPEPLTPSASPDDALDGGDLARAIGIALAIGLAVAFLVGRPSCSADPPKPKVPSSGVGSAAGSGSGSKSGSGSASSVPGGGAGAPGYQLGPDGHEQQVQIDADGHVSVTGADGQRYSVEQQGSSQVIRDSQGRIVGTVNPDSVVVRDASGQEQTFQRDENGNLYLDGKDGQRYFLSVDSDRITLRDGSGNVVGSGPLTADHLYIRDPDGNVVVPDSQGSGYLPVPGPGVDRGQNKPPTGQVTLRDAQGRTVVRDADGASRTYDTDPSGRPRVQVAPVDGSPPRSYVLDTDSQGQVIKEYDADGNLVDSHRYDPDGKIASLGSGSSPTTIPASSSASSAASPPSPSSVPWGLILGLAALVAAVAAAAWALTRDKDPAIERSWAERMSDRLDREGAAHGRARQRYETVVDYTRTLSDTLLPDPRVAGVGVVLSTALFSTADPAPETQAWAESVVDEVTQQHPAPRWTDRFRRTKAAPPPPASVEV